MHYGHGRQIRCKARCMGPDRQQLESEVQQHRIAYSETLINRLEAKENLGRLTRCIGENPDVGLDGTILLRRGFPPDS